MMQSKKANFGIILVLIVTIFAFAYSYNASVTSAVADAAYNDREILQNYNNEIIGKLTKQDNISQWSEIVEQYQDIVIVIENSSNKIVTKSIGRSWTALDVKVQTPFDYKGEAYLIRSSVYLLRDYVTDVRELVKFIFIEFLIGLSCLLLLVFIIYTAMLRPYRIIYKAIGEYDRTGKLSEVKLKGYAGKVYSRFVSMAKNLDRQQKTQRQIIASISHDIKTPLTSIMGYSEILKKDGLSDERRKRYLDTVYDKAVDIERLVGEFDEYLGYNMPCEIRTAPVSIKTIEKCIRSDYADEMAFTNINFTINVETESDVVINADLQKLKRVCSNILSNSVKHMKERDRFIHIDILSEDDNILLKFSDSGEGVPEDKLEMIFEPLYTSDEGRQVAGLGLSICREIVECHGGKITAEKSEMGGLAVLVRLPRG